MQSSTSTVIVNWSPENFPNNPAYTGVPSWAGSAFDSNWDTSFNKKNEGETWSGLDLGSRTPITSIDYLPKNDTNMILPGGENECSIGIKSGLA